MRRFALEMPAPQEACSLSSVHRDSNPLFNTICHLTNPAGPVFLYKRSVAQILGIASWWTSRQGFFGLTILGKIFGKPLLTGPFILYLPAYSTIDCT
jgi:hypothetical protein